MSEKVYEALINGSSTDTIDPIDYITIHNEYGTYDFKPKDIKTIEVREMKREH